MNRYFEDTMYYLRRAGESVLRGVRYEFDGLRGRARDEVAEQRTRAAAESRAYVDRARDRVRRRPPTEEDATA
jgi:hypothetical protein